MEILKCDTNASSDTKWKLQTLRAIQALQKLQKLQGIQALKRIKASSTKALKPKPAPLSRKWANSVVSSFLSALVLTSAVSKNSSILLVLVDSISQSQIQQIRLPQEDVRVLHDAVLDPVFVPLDCPLYPKFQSMQDGTSYELLIKRMYHQIIAS